MPQYQALNEAEIERLEAAGIRPDTAHALEPIEDAVVAVWHEMLVQGRLAPALSVKESA